MKKCNQCGATVNDDAVFCTVCGCRLSANNEANNFVGGTPNFEEDDFDSGATTVLTDNPYAPSQPAKKEPSVYTPQPASNYYQQNPNNYRNPAPQQPPMNYAQGGQAYGNPVQNQQPYQPGMGYAPTAKKNPLKAYADFWKNYANFNGRARRSDYWFVVLAEMVIGTVFVILAGIIMAIVYNATWDEEAMAVVAAVAGGIVGLYSLATIVPRLALTVRRLHDIGKGGIYLLMYLIPCGIGPIIILVYCCTDSQPGINQYGTSEKYPQLQQNNAYAQQGMR